VRNFRECGIGELRRIHLPGSRVNKGKNKEGPGRIAAPALRARSLRLPWRRESSSTLLYLTVILHSSGFLWTTSLQLHNPNRRRYRPCGGRHGPCAGAGPLWLPPETARW
jgi:hypothetical protein